MGFPLHRDGCDLAESRGNQEARLRGMNGAGGGTAGVCFVFRRCFFFRFLRAENSGSAGKEGRARSLLVLSVQGENTLVLMVTASNYDPSRNCEEDLLS